MGYEETLHFVGVNTDSSTGTATYSTKRLYKE